MFICDGCGEVSAPRDKCHVIPVSLRRRAYFPNSRGWEIKKEGYFCDRCRPAADTSFEQAVKSIKEV